MDDAGRQDRIDRLARRRRSLAPRWPLALTDSPRAPFWLARLLEDAGEWLFLLWLLVSGLTLTGDARMAGVLLAAWLVARPLLPLAGERLRPVVGRQATLLLALARGGVAALAVLLPPSAELLVLAALIFGALSAWADASRSAAIRRLFGGSAISAAGTLDAIIGRLAMVLGGTIAALLLALLPAAAAWLAALALVSAWLVLVALVGWQRRPALPGPSDDMATATGPGGPAEPGPAPPPSLFVPLDQPRAATILAAGAGIGALFGGLIGVLPSLAARTADAPALAGLGVAAIGAGALLLRLPVSRVRLRVPAVLLPPLFVLLAAVAVVVAVVSGSLAIALPLLFLLGSLGAALDGELLIRLRRLGEAIPTLLVGVLVAVSGGQLVGALAVALLGSAATDLAGPLTPVALAAAALSALGLFVDRAAIAGARHQVQQFSWDADPPPRPAEPHPAGSRAARLNGWIARQVETELVDVTLPQSGRHYAIARPSGDGRDSLFEAAKQDPERQMPYWAKVWPSGVALADVVVERADEVRGRQVLELGAGLGVTACAVLEEGGRILTADYSLLPLALCRLNGLANTGRAPGSLCFNWRDDGQVREVIRRHPPIGLVLAADVLYEFRDIEPLIGVLDRMLAVDGSLWLAEPVRKTAQRFLDLVAGLGWQVESMTIRADWPDATSGRVNVHVIRRERSPAEAALGVGGWQI